jgi:hypothetical protein
LRAPRFWCVVGLQALGASAVGSRRGLKASGALGQSGPSVVVAARRRSAWCRWCAQCSGCLRWARRSSVTRSASADALNTKSMRSALLLPWWAMIPAARQSGSEFVDLFAGVAVDQGHAVDRPERHRSVVLVCGLGAWADAWPSLRWTTVRPWYRTPRRRGRRLHPGVGRRSTALARRCDVREGRQVFGVVAIGQPEIIEGDPLPGRGSARSAYPPNWAFSQAITSDSR